MKSKVIKAVSRLKSQLKIRVNDVSIIFDTTSSISKKWFYPRYFKGQSHEPCISNLFYNEVGKEDVVFDIGANQGYFTVLCSQLLNNKGSVHAFELDPVLIPLAKNSLALNNYECDVSLIQCAVSNKDGDLLSFSPHIGDNLTTNSILYKNNTNTKIISQTLAIDSYCNKQNIKPDFIKLDVEGAEYFALHGMKQTLTNYMPKLLIEIHPLQLRESNINVEKIAEMILEFAPNYNVYLVEDYRIKEKDCMKKVSLDEIVYHERPVVLYFKEN